MTMSKVLKQKHELWTVYSLATIFIFKLVAHSNKIWKLEIDNKKTKQTLSVEFNKIICLNKFLLLKYTYIHKQSISKCYANKKNLDNYKTNDWKIKTFF